MKITWEVEEGYAGGHRPHFSSINDRDIKSCDTIEDAMLLIDEILAEDFSNRISFIYDIEKVREEVIELRKGTDNG